MIQSRLSSFIESIFNIIIGGTVALGSQLIIFPMFGIFISIQTDLWITAWFTVISLIRTYIIRRWFNARLHRIAQNLTGENNER